MTYLHLFWEFLKIGLFTFGGGYGAIPLIQDAVNANFDVWGVSQDLFSYIIGVAESTPGPIMVNTATYIGTLVGGVPGAIAATLGAITPSFVVILLIARFLSDFMEKKGTRAVLDTIKPCVVGIILCTGVYFILSGLIPEIATVFSAGFFPPPSALIPDWRTLLIFGLVFLLRSAYRLWKKKTISPILSIAISAVMGIAVFGV
ncbi:MAG: chromate transporter [Clostridia bacterium]|nr:chromate transporter [Clostridia bacterium]